MLFMKTEKIPLNPSAPLSKQYVQDELCEIHEFSKNSVNNRQNGKTFYSLRCVILFWLFFVQTNKLGTILYINFWGPRPEIYII